MGTRETPDTDFRPEWRHGEMDVRKGAEGAELTHRRSLDSQAVGAETPETDRSGQCFPGNPGSAGGSVDRDGAQRGLWGSFASRVSLPQRPAPSASSQHPVLPPRITLRAARASGAVRALQDPDAAPAPSARTAATGRVSGTFLTYARARLDTFAARPLCRVDSLVFAWLSYFRVPAVLRAARTGEGIALHELLRAEDFAPMFGTTWDPQGSRDLLFAVCASPRFRDARLAWLAYKTDRATSEQFAAMTFLLPGGGAYVAFRGTDSTLVGWREDFDMASRLPVPSQTEARAYLERVAAATDGPLYVGGHSKGGNLAVYAAACCAPGIQRRIVRVFSHDGPGFDRSFTAGAGFARVRDRVDKTVPKSSVIGLIMDTDHDFTVVESSGVSVLQHNPFLWEVEGCDFVTADGLSASSRYFGSTLAAWMDRFTPQERGAFIGTLFDVLAVTGASRFADIRETWRSSLPAMRAAVEALPDDRRAFVADVLKALVRVATIDRVSGAASSIADALWPGRGTDDADGVDAVMDRLLDGKEPDTDGEQPDRAPGAQCAVNAPVQADRGGAEGQGDGYTVGA